MDQNTQDDTAAGADQPPVLISGNDGVVVITLNRPKAINALSEDMLAALQDSFDKIAADRAIRAVILRSSSGHFCAGHNLKEMTARRRDDDGGKGYFIDLFETCSTLMKTIVTLPQPVIAEVRGIATAAGCQLVAAQISPWHPKMPALRHRGSLSACSAQISWWPCHAIFHVSRRWKCCCWGISARRTRLPDGTRQSGGC